MSINKITRKEYPNDFDNWIDDLSEYSHYSHRRGSSFYVKSIIVIKESLDPNFPELWGTWETNQYTRDDNYGPERSEIYELNRVVQREKIVKTIEWVRVEDEKNMSSLESATPII